MPAPQDEGVEGGMGLGLGHPVKVDPPVDADRPRRSRSSVLRSMPAEEPGSERAGGFGRLNRHGCPGGGRNARVGT